MQCYPAIDVRAGRSVRLLRGDFGAETTYGDPVDQAARYAAAGASILHVVDLDAARTGAPTQLSVIAAICATVEIPVEVGGGVRDRARAEELFASGADRVVLGTRAVEDPSFATSLADAFPGRVAVGLDYRSRPGVPERREVAVRGWEAGSGLDLLELVVRFADAPLAAVIATDISQDGTLEGPDIEGYRALLALTAQPVVASGGVGSLDDLSALAALSVDGRSLAGAIVGRALVEGAFSIEGAVAACGR